MHCGEVKEGVFQDGRKVSANRVAKILKLTNQKCQADGSVLKKIERFSKQGVERYFCKDDEKIAKVISRLNQDNNSESWLSMRPQAQFFNQKKDLTDFGEFEENRLNGRVIEIYNSGRIAIGYFENGWPSTGNYIEVYSSGGFRVGEYYMKDGRRWNRGTWYFTSGKEEEYDL